MDEIGPDATPIEFFNGHGAGHGSAFGVFETLDDIDVFQFTVESEMPFKGYSVPFMSGATAFSLLDGEGSVLVTATTSFEDSEAILEYDLTAGTYYLTATQLEGSDFGGFYHVEVQVGEPDVIIDPPPIDPPPIVDDHADTIGADSTIVEFWENGDSTRSGIVEGHLGSADDVDTFQFTIDEPLPLAGVSFPWGTEGDFKIDLLDSDGNTITSVANDVDKPFDLVPIEADLDAGLYYLSISGSSAIENFYWIDLRLGEAVIVDDHANEVGPDATPVELDSTRGALIGYGGGVLAEEGDVDVFQFELAEDQPVRLHFDDLFSGATLTLSNASGDTIAVLDPSLENTRPEPFELPADTYFITVEGAMGEFYFEIVAGTPEPLADDHVDDLTDAASVLGVQGDDGVFSGIAEGILDDLVEDVDVFQFELHTATSLEFFDLFFAPDATYELLTEDGTLLRSFEQGTIEVVDLDVGRYFVRVSGPADFSGNYLLLVNAGPQILPVAE